MYIKQLYTNCLAEAAYYIESEGEAAIVDPLRDVDQYIALSESRGAKIKYIFETHFHADFISGHVDLAKKTGAKIIYGPDAYADFDMISATDNQIFQLNKIKIKVLHTPGHTLESCCFLVIDEFGKNHSLFSGDTLFVGDVGRPDLATNESLDKKDLARLLYQSINSKLLVLADDVIIYPGHGAGSQCGKSLGEDTQSTIGKQKRENYALQLKTETKFVSNIVRGLIEPPQYFHKNAKINKQECDSIGTILLKSNAPLGVEEFKQKMNEPGIVILDTREASKFQNGFVKGSINIGLEGFFAVWAGSLIKALNSPILLITKDGDEEEATLRLARVGFENVKGFLKGGFNSWLINGENIDKIDSMCPVVFKVLKSEIKILDVRTKLEYNKEHVDHALNLPLPELTRRLTELDKDSTYYIYCKSGYRSMIACSILKEEGYTNVINIKKGFEGISNPKMNCCCSKEMT